MTTFSYCPPNVSLSTVWSGGGFSECFLQTLDGALLGGVMLLFGTFEIIMYVRFGTRVDKKMKEFKYFYSAQVGCMIMLMFLPTVRLVLMLTVYHAVERVYGYTLLRVLSSIYVWLMSIVLVRLERNFDLPTPPIRGHSLLLLIFWSLALICDILALIDISAKSWINSLSHIKTLINFCILVLHFICVFAVFVLGLKAPGLPSMYRRYLFMYHKLPGTSGEGSLSRRSQQNQYGSTDSTVFNLDLDLPSSIEVLQNQVETGEAMRQYEQLPRQKSNLRTVAACTAENRCKNRHLNILPYDATRVILQEQPDGETYINASRLTHFLPSSDIARSYIATQGPLPNTVSDFWQMIFENMCGMIVMICNLTESGSSACAQYWPAPSECAEHGKLVVTCVNEIDPSQAYFARKPYILREFAVFHLETQQELTVTQFQFINWPTDKAKVPSKPAVFVDFMNEVQSQENVAVGPMVVHCSSGIDRTGVFILLDLARSLMELEQPIRPVELLRVMRNQRPGMIPRGSEYRFTIDCIFVAYQRYAKRAGAPAFRRY